ncbi:17-beta-hydroxysteroid dehydrogenase 14-like [Paramuricea clavata]|uniref:17-beta-hydroxysteroid dehydrogenase 14-like n=1 Tax=Paramuricea clavata TaxID=317549 RepID=A0A6S7JM96_PARCT|nr:17-beta-hydroxysteroid dehydrogenase 14-like [Paramuricea clavata]
MEARLRYHDKVVIVTGGSKGIGEGIVREFVKEGSKVVFCARGEAIGRKLEQELNEKGPGESFFIACDIRKEDDLKNLVDKTVAKYGQIDCIVNNAGWHPPSTTIDDTTTEAFKSLLEFNLVSYFLLCKFSMPYLRQTKGNIINISSLVSMIGQEGAVAYCATKGGIASMTRALAVDEAKRGVRVNCVSPGNVWTPLWDEYASAESDKDSAVRDGEQAQLLGRMGTIEEMGKCCVYVAAEGTFMTGIDLPVSGGAELGYGQKSQ